MAHDISIFISHKMPKDSAAASTIGQLIAMHSGSKIKINLAEDFHKGQQLTSAITEAIQSADIFVLLYTGEDQDWGYCLLEAGQFQATLGNKAAGPGADATKSIVVFHDPKTSTPKALGGYIAVPISDESVHGFLKDLYVERGIFPGIDPSTLLETTQKICKAFHRTEVSGINFDLVPNFSIELRRSDANFKTLEDEHIPDEASLMGSQKWQALFGKEASTGGWTWADLSNNWVDRSIYEPELARMIRTAVNNRDAPQGCFMRPSKTNDLYRLTLRRYEKADDDSKLTFYFTASPIELPIFGIHDTADKMELTLYNLINTTWYARRKLIDQLYDQLLSYVNSVREDPNEISEIVTGIKDELRSINIQASIRGLSRPMDAVGADGDSDRSKSLTGLMQDELSWNTLTKDIFACSKQTPMDLKKMVAALYKMAVINQKYYQMSAANYAKTAQKLELPMAPITEQPAS
jgi:hypothetical protein